MRRRKRIVHISMRRRECGGKVGINGFFSGVKARVLGNANAPSGKPVRAVVAACPMQSPAKVICVHQLPGLLLQLPSSGSDRHTFGTPEMRQNTDPHAGRCQRFKRRQKPCKPRGIAQISRIVNRNI